MDGGGPTPRIWIWLVVVFVSGAAVMSFEILSARAIAPVYGQSLHVWASVIGLTLGALTIGYFLGGWAIDRRPAASTVMWTLIAAAIATAVMPMLATPILELTEPLGLRLGALVASFLILVLPLTALGMVTPAVTRLATLSVASVGKTAGTIYAVSTLGGILSSFGVGFYTLPFWGILATALVTSLSLVGAAALAGISGRLWPAAVAAPVLALVPLASSWISPAPPKGLILDTEGLMGRLTVLDNGPQRWLFIDGVGQTNVNRAAGRSGFQYIHCLTFFGGHYPPGSRTLILGLGGGSLANELRRLELEVDAVEIDERIARIAREHFSLDPGVEVFVGDARRFVRTCGRRYSYIALDCFTAEREPTHLLTLESLREMDRILEPDGIIALDYRGYLEGTRGLGARSILRTFQVAGFRPFSYGTAADEEERDLILGGIKDIRRFREERSLRLNEACCAAAVQAMLRHRLQPALHDAFVLTDDRSPLDVLNTVYHERWRVNARAGFKELMGQ
jgi:predicted membrane-bound spermidine synthase